MEKDAPLAFRLRPKTLDEFYGQEDIIGPGSALRKGIETDALASIILAGPPGTGKTTLAHIIAERTNAQFVTLNAVTSGVADLKAVCQEAEQIRTGLGQRTILFIDEIHRFNKAQQDALLPYVESGAVILIGATTENPYFDVRSAILSRSQVYLLKPLTMENLVSILDRAVQHSDGFGGKIKMSKDALEYIARVSNGDARIALNALEAAVMTIGTNITLEKAQEMLKKRAHRYDEKGEDHYDTISAFIKTLRGSDVDAALIWLYKMIRSGEEPRFIFRRMAILASEDVGNADPRALPFVVSAWQAFEMVGMPEGEFFLAHACVYLAQAPKSNAITVAKGMAAHVVDIASSLEVPYQIRNAPVKKMRDHGYHVGYQYTHNDQKGVVAENYFPIGMEPQNFYEPTVRGFEKEVQERWEETKRIVRATKKKVLSARK